MYRSLAGDHAVEIDGMNVMPLGSASCTCIYYDTGGAEQFVYQVNAGNADTQTGGVKVKCNTKGRGQISFHLRV